MTEKWWQSSVVYQIYPRSFYDSNNDGIGDIQGIISKLDYLSYLGIDVIWLSPVYSSPNADNGYDISDYQNIMSEFGTMNDMDELLRKCEERNIKVIMDLVVNHTSDEHPWFIEAKKSKNNPYRDFYIWRDCKDGHEPNDLASNFGGSAWEFDESTGQYYLHFYSVKQPDLNWENEILRNEIYKMMNFWINKGIGGFRMDVIDLIGKNPDKKIKENGPNLHKYIQEMNKNTFGNKDLLTVGETWGANCDNAKLYCDPNRNELNMIFQFEQIQLDKQKNKSRWDLKKLDLVELKKVLSKWQTELDEVGWNSLFWNNHDLPRIVSRWGNDKDYRKESAKMLATLLHGMKGTPYIYQGEEIGMTNFYSDNIDDYPDIETQNIYKERISKNYSHEEVIHSIQIKARDNARTPMQWSNSINGGFTKGTPWMKVNPNYTFINVDESIKDTDSVLHYYKKLINLRKENEIIRFGKYVVIDKNNPNIYAYERILNYEKLVVICNFYSEATEFEYENIEKSSVLISTNENQIFDENKVHLRPYESMICLMRRKDNE